MPYEDIPIAHVLNYWLADGFDASDEKDLLKWLGKGKTLAEMLGPEVSRAFYTPERHKELSDWINYFGLLELQYYLNDRDDKSAVGLSLGRGGELVFFAGTPEGTPAIMTDWFKRNREQLRQ